MCLAGYFGSRIDADDYILACGDGQGVAIFIGLGDDIARCRINGLNDKAVQISWRWTLDIGAIILKLGAMAGTDKLAFLVVPVI